MPMGDITFVDSKGRVQIVSPEEGERKGWRKATEVDVYLATNPRTSRFYNEDKFMAWMRGAEKKPVGQPLLFEVFERKLGDLVQVRQDFQRFVVERFGWRKLTNRQITERIAKRPPTRSARFRPRRK